MGPTRKRDLTAAVVGVAILTWLLMRILYHYFPPITLWTGLSLLAVAAIEAGWAVSVRAKIGDGQIGVGGGRLHPLTVARSVVIAKASAWVGALMLGWWTGVLVYLLLRRSRAGGGQLHPGCRGGRLERPGPGGRGGVAAALLQVARRPDRRPRRRPGVVATELSGGPLGANRRSSTTRGRTSRGYSHPMTVLSRGARNRRGGRRPGWLLLTVLLVLAIAASSALVFTNRAELLKLAVILSLWAAVIAAFVSVIYRRQSDIDAARARDLKLVYDLQLDREISARREYELSVESHLRRELASELRAQAADEVAALRSELAALRANLEILFDADLGDRPALEGDRAGDWTRDTTTMPPVPGRVESSRITPVRPEDTGSRPVTAENPIIDVPEEPLVPPQPYAPPPPPRRRRRAEAEPEPVLGGSHRRPSENGEQPADRPFAPPPPRPSRNPTSRPRPRPWRRRSPPHVRRRNGDRWMPVANGCRRARPAATGWRTPTAASSSRRPRQPRPPPRSRAAGTGPRRKKPHRPPNRSRSPSPSR